MASPYALFVQQKGTPQVYGVSSAGQYTPLDANAYKAAGGSTTVDPTTGIYQGVQLRDTLPMGTGIGQLNPATTPQSISATQLAQPQPPVNVSSTLPQPGPDA